MEHLPIAFYGCLVLFFLIALILRFFYPKNINHLVGFRTEKSMQNQENWLKAQELSGKYLLLSVSIFDVVLLGLVWLFGISETILLVQVFGFVAILVAIIIVINKKI
ncbi:MAG: SdpI family protein [Bacteroidetes bacterium]|nr:SdpI family protein [Bacteroidota bacterium]